MRPPLSMACPPMSWLASMTMTEAPWSRAMMAAGSPEAPAPTMTTSAVWSKRLCAVAAAAPRPVAALLFRKFLRFTALPFLSMAADPFGADLVHHSAHAGQEAGCGRGRPPYFRIVYGADVTSA